jgi:signal transduction histidine kinase
MAALRLVGARVAALYCLPVAITVPVVALPGRPWAALSGTVVTVAAGLVMFLALRRPPSPPRVGAVAGVHLLAMLTLPMLTSTVGGRNADLLLGFVANALVIGVAAAWGPRLGVAGLAWAMLTWAGGALAWGGGASPVAMLGSFTAGLIGLIIGIIVPRGYAVTQTALDAVEGAQVARGVAAARWAGRLRQIRALHDTVLSTLSVIAQGGAGVPVEALRADCTEQIAVLQRAGAGLLVGRQPGPRGERPLRSGAADAAAALTELLRRWRDRGLVVDRYGGDPGQVLAALDAEAATDLLAAVDQCLENVRRHSGVRVATLTLTGTDREVYCTIIDEGVGFDSADPAAIAGRIGLAQSVIGRIRDAGGTAKVWSRPGAGTSIALELPCHHGVRPVDEVTR